MCTYELRYYTNCGHTSQEKWDNCNVCVGFTFCSDPRKRNVETETKRNYCPKCREERGRIGCRKEEEERERERQRDEMNDMLTYLR